MKKYIILFFSFFFFSFDVSSALNQYIGCFSSESKKINVKFVEINISDARLAYVKYKNSSKSIPLIYFSSAEEVVAEGRPSEITTTWLEFISGKFSGEYTVLTQGARFYKISYKNNNGKSVDMIENSNAYNDDWSNCLWK